MKGVLHRYTRASRLAAHPACTPVRTPIHSHARGASAVLWTGPLYMVMAYIVIAAQRLQSCQLDRSHARKPRLAEPGRQN